MARWSVVAGGVQVRFRDAGGRELAADFALVPVEVLAAGRPWRVFRWHRGQTHYSGWYWSATMGRHVVYESRLELARLLLADFDPQVRVIAAQPFLVCGPAEDGRVRRHVPDFLLVDRVGLVTVVNVKPAGRLADAKVAGSLRWAGAVFATRGWHHEVWSQAPPVVLANVRFLAAYRHPARVEPEAVAWVGQAAGAGVSIGELEAAWPGQPTGVRSAVLHLLWRGVLRADLSQPLSAETVLGRAA